MSSPSIGRIVFVTGKGDGAENGHIVVVNADGTDLREIVSVGRSEGPTWVPGTEQILFDGATDGYIHIFSIAADGSARQQITFGARYVGFPSVSPDGTTVAVDYDPVTSPGGIFLLDIDGANPRRLSEQAPEGSFDTAPAFSPDGTRVAFMRKGNPPDYDQSAIFVVNLDGSGQQQLTSDWALNPGPPRWTPDGRSLVFSDHAETGTAATAVNVWLVGADGTNLRQVTDNEPGDFDFSPDFSPDGSRLVIVRYRPDAEGLNSLWTMKVDGTDAREIYKGQAGWYVEWPRWEN